MSDATLIHIAVTFLALFLTAQVHQPYRSINSCALIIIFYTNTCPIQGFIPPRIFLASLPEGTSSIVQTLIPCPPSPCRNPEKPSHLTGIIPHHAFFMNSQYHKIRNYFLARYSDFHPISASKNSDFAMSAVL